MAKLKIVIVGAKGRMGTRIDALAAQDPSLEVVARVDADLMSGSQNDGKVVIDFSSPDASVSHLANAVKARQAYVLGTTGLTKDQEGAVIKAAESIAVVKSSNMSLGVNVFFSAAERIAKALPEYTAHVQETHHTHKKDAPSGTALQVGGIIEKATGKKVTYESLREGEVVGEHRIVFKGPTDTIELFHHADSRDIFAAGALKAARWASTQKPGLYSMQDVLALK